MSEIPHHEPVLKASRAKRIYLIAGIAIAVLLIAYGAYALMTSGKESTDDAQVAADVVPVAARVAGQVVAVYIHENQPLHRGDLIAELDPQEALVKLQQAQSDLATAQAQLIDAQSRIAVTTATAQGALVAAQGAERNARENVDTSAAAINEARAAIARSEANAKKARNDFARAEELGSKGDISRSQVDAARAARDSAEADLNSARARLSEAENARQAAQANVQQAQGRVVQSAPVSAQVASAQAQITLAQARVQSAEAAVKAAQLSVSYTKLTAPADGIAAKLSVRVGSFVATGQTIVDIVPRTTYIVANFKETQMKRLRPGERARIRVDALGGRDFEGKLESLSGGTGATFSLLPPDNASGNFVKVVQRVPVRVSWNGPPADQVPAGSSAEVTVYTK
jgi:membrane fusion protein (multidrug efflux system)